MTKFRSGKWTLPAGVLLVLTLGRCSGPPPIQENLGRAGASLEKLLDKAEQGNAEAQVRLGLRYKHGMRVPQDYAKALNWFLRASLQGNAFAQARLGAMYRDGLGGAQNYAEAAKWLRKSAEQGNSTAQLALGMLYKEGKGVPQDDEKALKWLKSAAAGSSDLPPGHFDYWDLPPIVPSPIMPIQVGADRPSDHESKPVIQDELARGRAQRQP
ncbi:MAG: tetratricopeptide repeat protein [Acidobacteriota bacterium]|nr:tetratricopeptide repeat protein [Acidobacteriota bacterium]